MILQEKYRLNYLYFASFGQVLNFGCSLRFISPLCFGPPFQSPLRFGPPFPSPLQDNEEVLISFSSTFLRNGFDLTQRFLHRVPLKP
ncbi:hypothetical protein BpHYR1_025905 [Brachionus plicatilis]|uniref:Uncharacterized protein n=1 Tax=Brachionus plicatilis TaxID=10195 RepID=A0A3M7QVF2_BRAPC|nr:hypothetical protein BpHYR1_025905 [Brachionus plicatilis]